MTAVAWPAIPWWRAAVAGVVMAVVAGCAVQPRQPASEAGETRDVWSGRLALRVDSPQPQSFNAGFELRGNAQDGQLSLFSPLGSTVAKMSWTPGDARLQADGKETRFASLAALTYQATGAELPVANLFHWLAGQPSATDGWQAELDKLADGRLVARRLQPPPAIELRLIIDP